MARARTILPALVLALALPLAGCEGGDGAPETTTTAAASPAPEAPPPAGERDAPAARAGSVIPDPETGAEPGELGLVFTSGEQFELVSRELPRRPAAALEALLAGPTGAERERRAEVQTSIPDGVEVEDVEIDGGTAEVRLSRKFLAGIPVNPRERNREQRAEADARLAQVALTLGQFQGVERTLVSSGGVAAAAPAERREYAPPRDAPRQTRGAERRRGNGSGPVRRLQSRLVELRYLPRGAVDGIDGYRTQQAVIAFQSWEKLDRDGVVGPMTKAALRSAKPPRPKLNGPPRRIEVYRDKGVTLLVEDGRTRRAIHSSSGAPGTETPRGQFEVFRKERNSWSVPFQQWLPYASYFFQGIAFHEYPDVPVYPASHGCVRIPAPEAPVVYDFASIGTAVSVR